MSITKLEDKSVTTVFTVTEALQDVLQDISDGEITATKCLVLLLDDRSGEYLTSWVNAGMKASEIVALCEFIKFRFLGKEMGQVPTIVQQCMSIEDLS